MTQPRSPLDWVLEAVSFITLLAIFGIVLANWTHLPAQVPLHFGVLGKPNRWGDKSGLLLLPLMATGIYVLLTVLSRYPRLANIPFRANRDAPEVQSLLVRMSITLKAVVMFVFLFIVRGIVNTAMGHSGGLGMPFLLTSLAAIFLTIGFFLFKLRSYRE